jgi:hypothetical protein
VCEKDDQAARGQALPPTVAVAQDGTEADPVQTGTVTLVASNVEDHNAIDGHAWLARMQAELGARLRVVEIGCLNAPAVAPRITLSTKKDRTFFWCRWSTVRLVDGERRVRIARSGPCLNDRGRDEIEREARALMR